MSTRSRCAASVGSSSLHHGVQALHKISWTKLHNHHWAGLFGLLLCCPMASLSRAEQSRAICHGCAESSSHSSHTSLVQLKHCRDFAPQHSPALRKTSFIQQLSPQCLSLSGKPGKCTLLCQDISPWCDLHTPTRATLRAPCVASNSDSLPTSSHLFFSCLLFSLFTFQELSEVFPVCLYPASVLIVLFFSPFFLYSLFPPPSLCSLS